MKKTISLVLVLVLGMATEVAKADFVFGTPTAFPYFATAPSVSTDGLTLYVDAPDGSGGWQIYVLTRETIDDDWANETKPTPPNSSYSDGNPDISADGLTLFFNSDRPGGYGGKDMWLSTRATADEPWSEPVNLGPAINGPYHEVQPSVSTDGLSLFFSIHSDRPGGYGDWDIWLSTRATTHDPWSEPVNLGPIVNSPSRDWGPDISSDGLKLFFASERPGGYGDNDIWVTRRATTDAPWSEPVNLGPIVNTSNNDYTPGISADDSILYFYSSNYLRQAPIEPVVDLNGDGIVDCADMCIMVDHWGTDEPLCDIGPTPLGDGIVDVNDLIVLAEHLFEGIPPVELEEVNVDEDDDGSQVELEQGQILVVTLESNPTTGYGWEVAEIQESILEQMGEAEFKPSETGGPIVGAGGWEIFRFEAISAGQLTLKLVYRRPWEVGVEPINTFSIEVVVN